MERLRDFIECRFFGVCTLLAEHIGVSISSVRLFFIYSTFLTFGSPIFIYLSIAFITRIRQFLRWRRALLFREG
ncbi:phage shock protein PspC (stress-responsive transcriptional regulator) [Thermonema lapsum]|uniref:Phage shock protein PspC (Stress-responsive transcriptional regulator) n=1 Tax=Thermonema lapsum TaxID=28195 RepID=A0A846MT69_9BACT|nr:phage shock protein PspC (stress-responsive transcriptional regulator) [Thermonema lapsum]